RAAGVITDPGSQRVKTTPVARDDGQVVATACQPFRISSADPTRCSGDQRRTRVLKRHSSLPEPGFEGSISTPARTRVECRRCHLYRQALTAVAKGRKRCPE